VESAFSLRCAFFQHFYQVNVNLILEKFAWRCSIELIDNLAQRPESDPFEVEQERPRRFILIV
jgi:hypothetical protein